MCEEGQRMKRLQESWHTRRRGVAPDATACVLASVSQHQKTPASLSLSRESCVRASDCIFLQGRNHSSTCCSLSHTRIHRREQQQQATLSSPATQKDGIRIHVCLLRGRGVRLTSPASSLSLSVCDVRVRRRGDETRDEVEGEKREEERNFTISDRVSECMRVSVSEYACNE